MKRNEGTLDRGVRVALGLALLAVGVGLQGGAGVVVAVVGLVPLLTGLAGRCPLYALLKIDTRGRHGTDTGAPHGAPR